jgi:hypothetical protein
LRHPIGDEESSLWEWLPATIPSRQDAAPTEENGRFRWKRVTARCAGLLLNEIPPAPFSKGGETPASSYSPFSKGGWGILKATPSETVENSYRDGVEGLCNDILNHHTFVSQDYSTKYCAQIKIIEIQGVGRLRVAHAFCLDHLMGLL